MRANSIFPFLGSALILSAHLAAAEDKDKDKDDRPTTVGGLTRGLLPTGQYITAEAARGSRFQLLETALRTDHNADANGAVTTAVSPDGSTLLVLTSGYNGGFGGNFSTMSGDAIEFPYLDPTTGAPSSTMTGSFQWVFVYDVATGFPVKQQQIPLPSAFVGLTWDPRGDRFYVSGGQDDRVYVYRYESGSWIADAPFITLGHNGSASAPKPDYDGGIFKNTPAGLSASGALYGLDFGAETAGIAVSPDSRYVLAVNMENDSVSTIDASSRQVLLETRLFIPGSTKAEGEYPFWVTAHAGPDGKMDKFYVTSMRDGQVIAISTSGERHVIEVGGEPGKMILSADGVWLFVANPDLDEVDIIDTRTERIVQRISVRRPGYAWRGANPNSLALTRDGRKLYVTLGGENAVAVIDVARGLVKGRIPTGWYPTSVSLSADEKRLFVVNRKSNAGPNPAGGLGNKSPDAVAANTTHRNDYIEALQKAGLLTIPVPNETVLARLSDLVDRNNNFDRRRRPSAMMQYLHQKIHHVIYIMKENRSYDQMLGDLSVGNGDPALTLFPRAITPNFHKLAEEFADLDNFYVESQSSGDGWGWTWQGHVNEFTELTESYYFAGQGPSGAMDFAPYFGSPRLVNLALPLRSFNPGPHSERITTLFDPSGQSTVLPGTKDPAATEGADDEGPDTVGGYIWDTVFRAGLTVRHYGIWNDQFMYYNYNGTSGVALQDEPYYIPIVRDAAAKRIVQGVVTKAPLKDHTDPYYRGWDLNEPDEYRYEEWKREFDHFVANGKMPNLEVMTMMMDHTGGFATNVAHLDTPSLDEADNDHAVAQLVDAVSHSPYWKSTIIFVVEDDSVDGPDHVSAHRSPGYVISPYVKRHSVVHTFYNVNSMLRTMEDILGVNYLGFNDANAASMDDLFTTEPDLTPYDVIVPGVLCRPPVDPALVPDCNNPHVERTAALPGRHDGAWWIAHTKQLNFNRPDANDPAVYNRILWAGIAGEKAPFPQRPSGRDLSKNRRALLEKVKIPGATAD